MYVRESATRRPQPDTLQLRGRHLFDLAVLTAAGIAPEPGATYPDADGARHTATASDLQDARQLAARIADVDPGSI